MDSQQARKRATELRQKLLQEGNADDIWPELCDLYDRSVAEAFNIQEGGQDEDLARRVTRIMAEKVKDTPQKAFLYLLQADTLCPRFLLKEKVDELFQYFAEEIGWEKTQGGFFWAIEIFLKKKIQGEKKDLDFIIDLDVSKSLDPAKLAKVHPKIHKSEAWRTSFHPNYFYTERVQWFISHKDWARAWSELRRANRGVTPPQPPTGRMVPYRGDFWAHDETLKKLLLELYQTMEGCGVKLCKPQEGFRASRHCNRAERAGFNLAYHVGLVASRRENPPNDNHQPGQYYFGRVGHMALILGEHFRTEANKKKRAKHEQAARKLKDK